MPDSIFSKLSRSESLGSQGSSSIAVSIGSLINLRRLTKKFTMSYFTRKKMSGSHFQDMIRYEPTYRMQPTKMLPLKEIHASVENLIHNKIGSMRYDPRKAVLMSQILCDDIKSDIKSFAIDRYKIVVHGFIGSKANQEIFCTGKSIWDTKSDYFLVFNHENLSLFVTVAVYFIYHE